jgi:hypothetical protein
MSDSPIPISRENETEIIKESSPEIQTLTSIDEQSIISDKTDLTILYKSDERTNSMSSHIDENNENEAVCNILNSIIDLLIILGCSTCYFICC